MMSLIEKIKNRFRSIFEPAPSDSMPESETSNQTSDSATSDDPFRNTPYGTEDKYLAHKEAQDMFIDREKEIWDKDRENKRSSG